jgi:uncharacterized membrane protein
LLRAWVERGGHFHMNGGWLSFAGELGKGGWGRSRFNDVLPVVCSPHDDLIESTAGYSFVCSQPEHAMAHGLDWSAAPPLLGFNECKLRDGAECPIQIDDRGRLRPLLAARGFGSGRVTCWLSGASPHWGINFMRWGQYAQFWRQVFEP